MSKGSIKILSIAGSDSSSGAGIQADIKTILSLGGYACTAVTCITAQNKLRINNVINIQDKVVMDQIKTVCCDTRFDAIKIGVIPSISLSKKLVNFFEPFKCPIVVDPVFVSSSGYDLVDRNIFIKNQMILSKISNVLTPNISETEKFLGFKISQKVGIRDRDIKELYRKFGIPLLITGGDLNNEYVIDTLYDGKNVTRYKNKKIKIKFTHGTGCSLASALSFYLADKKKLTQAVEYSIMYIRKVLLRSKNKNFNGYLHHYV